MCLVKSDNDVIACERGSCNLLTSSPVATPCWASMVVTIWIGVSMYGLRAGNVVRRMFWLTSPMLS